MSNHQIRLNRVWTVTTRAASLRSPNDLAPQGLRFERRFGLPTGLTPEDDVYLLVHLHEGRGILQLNGVTLGKIDSSVSHAFPINGRLELSNLLVFHPDSATHSERETQAEADQGHSSESTPASTQAFPGMVVLEIRSQRL
ncbi:MAG: hypothetical protein RIS70_1942 [Planctomycetota bacterium]|jgi:hypothetical protein